MALASQPGHLDGISRRLPTPALWRGGLLCCALLIGVIPNLHSAPLSRSAAAPARALPHQSTSQAQTNEPTRQAAKLEWFPDTHFYPRYIADPLRPTFSAQTMFFDYTEIPDAGRRRFGLKIGGRLGLLRLPRRTNPDLGWQLALEVGFHGQFDVDESQDNIGWDGIYALDAAYRLSEALAFRVGTRHISAHIGDEYMQRTGRERIQYTRQEIRAGLVWSIKKRLQTYADAGYGYDSLNRELQEPWRVQAGVQYEDPFVWARQRFGWYAALDLSTYEESDWSVNAAIQAGLVYPAKQRRWRLGVEYYDGRSQLGEFFQFKERYTSLGIWMDL
ncbi:MAG: DUF1207 domain-containing protein [Pseudomonadota bacterium]|nr:MAG: DUF1207 domain-containing protein [Pseudomonadota bacterium]